ncbi:hypothetical protein KOW79_017016 [Hemibagrus wyckioides]|uniref:Uncharacterized protein n=1 Tax=Hemibagrus wyckioides TaxID=337641 RepID=A0A9D3NEM2_9TELE|nr:hypothetical protein KOW79_017016 [Hemibagrus wyckioides]
MKSSASSNCCCKSCNDPEALLARSFLTHRLSWVEIRQLGTDGKKTAWARSFTRPRLKHSTARVFYRAGAGSPGLHFPRGSEAHCEAPEAQQESSELRSKHTAQPRDERLSLEAMTWRTLGSGER